MSGPVGRLERGEVSVDGKGGRATGSSYMFHRDGPCLEWMHRLKVSCSCGQRGGFFSSPKHSGKHGKHCASIGHEQAR